ncbi:hypothetical protein R5R35_003142 [Gryllus longicercus]|uniref:Uncharacterized protein n=1 Tax=Gryllus longicercus TaxID=2509291 RepID=A0AAN9VU15_9ORTH
MYASFALYRKLLDEKRFSGKKSTGGSPTPAVHRPDRRQQESLSRTRSGPCRDVQRPEKVRVSTAQCAVLAVGKPYMQRRRRRRRRRVERGRPPAAKTAAPATRSQPAPPPCHAAAAADAAAAERSGLGRGRAAPRLVRCKRTGSTPPAAAAAGHFPG